MAQPVCLGHAKPAGGFCRFLLGRFADTGVLARFSTRIMASVRGRIGQATENSITVWISDVQSPPAPRTHKSHGQRITAQRIAAEGSS
jgi:hypothetical protein